METATSLDSSSSEDLDNLCIDHEIDDIDISDSPRKPHFLDYDAVPPPGFEDDLPSINNLVISHNSKVITPTSASSVCGDNEYPGENVKVDKKYERDGEISDYELAASGITKRELTPQRKCPQKNSNNSNNNNNNNNNNNVNDNSSHYQKHTGARKKKHFLDENPIPPDYMLDTEREHRSLDRNFERQNEFENFQKYDRKHSLERESRFRKVKEPNYTLSRFIENDIDSSCRGGTWPVERPSDNAFNYSSMPPENVMNLGPKVECVYSLLSMLGSHDSVEMSKKFLELSRTTETCATLRRSGCIPLLVQMMHSNGDEGARKRAAAALHNVVHCHPDDKAGRREAKVLRLIEQIMDYCNFLKSLLVSGGEAIADDSDRHPLAAISSLMKVSFDEEHRHAMCQLGALQAIASLVHLDHAVHGPEPEDQCCNSLRRYALMALTNLTFGDGNNKALLCANKDFMEALVAQLDSAPDDLLQVTASVLRNLSWRADNNMKAVLNEIGTVTALAKAAMKNKNENTLKAILSALWNLSAHCSTNKAEFCSVEGALAFLVDMLTYEGPSKTLKVIENAGGILRNVSSHIAVREDYRKILRQRNCLAILLQQLKSESLTVVSNACGTLWNLSARCQEDQKYLWDNGAVPMLRSLIHSKHKMISEGSSAALKNLLNFRPGALNQNSIDPIAKAMGLRELPTLNARKQRALEQELNRNLAETCDNLDVVTPLKEKKEFIVTASDSIDTHKNLSIGIRLTRSAVVSKSESRDSIVSAKSDSIYEKLRRGHSAPPLHNPISKDKTIGMRNNFMVKREFDVEQIEQPIDYSAKYNNESSVNSQKNGNQLKASSNREKEPQKSSDERNFSTEYQETDLDQPTDFSLRYAENQVESDTEEKSTTTGGEGNEIILILEDTVKCYQTEDTPYMISNAGSITDLRNSKHEEVVVAPPTKRISIKTTPEVVQNYGFGTYTPEKPINYCEEGTPGYFSRYESLSSLDESPPNSNNTAANKVKPEVLTEEPQIEGKVMAEEQIIEQNLKINAPIRPEVQKSTTSNPSIQAVISNPNRISANSAQETPLMFSRRSSMDSLASAEPITADDKSSVVSDFSRLASGVISPSELPDSPTQSMPQSPRRNSNNASGVISFNSGNSCSISQRGASAVAGPSSQKQRLRSVFEDETSTFLVENTPAQFSCATSLSNLSLDDEPKIATDTVIKELILLDQQSPKDVITTENESACGIEPKKIKEKNKNKTSESCAISDGEETTNDDLLLATCINIGMNKGSSSSKLATSHSSSNLQNHTENSSELPTKEMSVGEDVIKRYCTEDTPALLSKVGSNSNLSALSISSTNKEIERAVNLSDESSNTSDGGSDLLEQCIREGMQKKSISKKQNKVENATSSTTILVDQQSVQLNVIASKDPIAMLRRGGLPPYLPVRDEMSKFVVEDSPCNFSVISGLSNLTVGSGVAGPANIKSTPVKDISGKKSNDLTNNEGRRMGEDSLSSISIESEDDTNLLSQAIAAGYNKSTKGHTSNKNVAGVVNAMPTTSKHRTDFNEANDSLSSVDSSDSNDYQAKSLFEQCIRTGMNKQSKKMERHQHQHQTHQAQMQSSNKPVVSPKRSQLPTFSYPSTIAAATNPKMPIKMPDRERQKERERKDEQLLRECINTGIAKSVRTVDQQQQAQIKPPTKHVRQILAPTDFSQRLVTGASMDEREHYQPSVTGAAITGGVATNSNSSVSKNGEATSAVVLEQHQLVTITSQSAPSTAPDVEMREPPEGITSIESKNQSINQPLVWADRHQQIGNSRAQQQQQNIIGSDLFETSQGSLNVSGDGFLLDQSNEYPALKLSNIDLIEDSVNETSFDMDVSNEFLIERDTSEEEAISSQKIIQDKHKDPDLMLKSVERLTQELVSTAEYLRTTNASNKHSAEREVELQDFDNISTSTMYDKKSGSNSNSNNTWNEDTCPNDVSFPSISFTAPMIASMNDDETTTTSELISIHQPKDGFQLFVDKTPTNENYIFNTNFDCNEDPNKMVILDEIERNSSQPNSLETETDTLINDETDGSVCSSTNKHSNINDSGIQFKVGGEVQQQSLLSTGSVHQFVSSGPMSFDFSSTLTNSTMIAMEANKLANDLMLCKMSSSTTSLDLDNIRPPSGMESLSMSGCFDMPPPSQSPQLSRLRKKSLPAGLVARRALAGGGQNQLHCGMSGSLESVNSSCNLDNIKPPSLMDELLDSMISVESITSEIVDNNSLGMHTAVTTHYETAFSDVDDNTTTLQSCMDALLPSDYDSNCGGTPIPSDFSSAESTPRKGQKSVSNIFPGIKRTLTPKQKRRVIKDRFKTYTIAADYVLKEDYGVVGDKQHQQQQKENISEFGEDDEIMRIEIEHEIPEEIDQQGKNIELSAEQVNGTAELNNDPGSASVSARRRTLDPDRYKTRTIIYDRNAVIDKNVTGSKAFPQPKMMENESLTSNEEDTDELTSIRALTKQFKFITAAVESSSVSQLQQQGENEKKQMNGAPIINSMIRAKLLEEEKHTSETAITIESDYHSMDCDQNSETESCGGGDQNYSSKTDDEDMCSKPDSAIQKPKIVKSNDKDSGTEINCSEDSMTPPETVKTVRGRKKPAYVSPYKKSVLSNSSSRTTSPKSQLNTSNVCRANLATKNIIPDVKKTLTGKSIQTRNQPIVAKTHVLVNKSNLTNKFSGAKSGIKNSSNVKKNTLTEKNLINKMTNGNTKSKETSTTSTATGLQRQGTFTKDEPSNAEVPIVNSLPTSPVKTSKLPTKLKGNGKSSNGPNSPIKSATTSTSKSKLGIMQKNTDTFAVKKLQIKHTSTSIFKPRGLNNDGRDGTASNVETVLKKKTTMIGSRKSNIPMIPPQRSNSNASIRTTTALNVLRTNLPSTTPPSRSNSNLTSGSAGGKPTGISSRIASIWKKVDGESKKVGSKIVSKPTMNSGNKKISKITKNPDTFGSSDTIEETTIVENEDHQLKRKVNLPACNTGTFLIRRSKNVNHESVA